MSKIIANMGNAGMGNTFSNICYFTIYQHTFFTEITFQTRKITHLGHTYFKFDCLFNKIYEKKF